MENNSAKWYPLPKLLSTSWLHRQDCIACKVWWLLLIHLKPTKKKRPQQWPLCVTFKLLSSPDERQQQNSKVASEIYIAVSLSSQSWEIPPWLPLFP